MAAVADCLDREHYDSERKNLGVGLPIDHRAAQLDPERRGARSVYRLIEFIGRWSMIDVFVDTLPLAQAAN